MKLVSALLGVALAASLVAVTPAQAAPTPTAPVTTEAAKPKPVKHTVRITDARHDDFNLARKVQDTAENKKGQTNWAKAKKIFGKHSTLRDGYGAGLYMFSRNLNTNAMNWSSFTNITKADKGKILGYMVEHGINPPKPKSGALKGSAKLAPIKCQGQSWFDSNGDKNWSYIMYLDSCDTLRVVALIGICMPVAGTIGAIAGIVGKSAGIAVAMSILSLTCAGTAGWFLLASSLSDVHAIKIEAGKTAYNKVRHTWDSPVMILPQ